MSIEVKVPTLGESITEAVVLEWLVTVGDIVTADQDLVVLETDKITVNVPAPAGGEIVSLAVGVDDEVSVGGVIAVIDESRAGRAPKPQAPATKSREPAPAAGASVPAPEAAAGAAALMPAVRRLVSEHGLDPAIIPATGRGGRLLKEDVLRYLEAQRQAASAAREAARGAEQAREARASIPSLPPPRAAEARDAREEVVAMSSLRRRIAERLVSAQRETASLTTFNEIDMSAVIALRKQYKQAFQDKHGIKLGFMGFFAKAAIEALKAYPGVNAEIRGDSVVYKNFYDIGVAVGGGRGLVVPVIRDADRLSFAGFEAKLAELADKAMNNRLSLEEMTGGTFTLSNGGIYGSLLSTPILNPPQSGILGLHKIEERPVAIDGQVVVRPMMYVALTYDHRLVDGREAVSFLVRVKECIEDPGRILLEV